MTNEQLRKIDALVAEHAMQYVTAYTNPERSELFIVVDQAKSEFKEIPYYSTNISDAWEVVKAIQENQPASTFTLKQLYDGMWMCSFSFYTSHLAEVHKDTAELSICLAALKVKGIDVEKSLDK